MSYLLLIPLMTYVALAVFTRQQHPRSDAGHLLSGFLLALTIATVGELILGTTSESIAAIIGAGLSLSGNIVANLTLPFIPIALVYGRLPFVKGHRSGWWISFASMALLLVGIVVMLIGLPGIAIVTRDSGGYYHLVRPDAHPAAMTGYLIGIVCPLLAAGMALLLTYWGHIVHPRDGATTAAGMLIMALVPLFQHDLGSWLRFVMLAGIFTGFLTTYRRSHPLHEMLRTLYAGQVDSLLVLDEQGHVVWLNEAARRRLGVVPDGPRLNPALVLAGEPYASAWRWLETMPPLQATHEFPMPDGDSHYTLVARAEPLPRLAGLQRGRVIRLVQAATRQQDQREVFVHDPLQQLSRTLENGLDMQSVLADALDTVLQVTDLDAALVFLLDSRSPDLLRVAATYGDMVAQLDVPQVLSVSDSFAAIEQGQSILLDSRSGQRDTKTDYDAFKQEGVQNGLAVPLMAHGYVLGVLIFLALEPHDFPPNELLLLESVGRQLGVTYDSAYLHAAEYRQRVQAEVLNDIVTTMVSVTSSDDVLESVMEQLHRLIEYDSAAIALFSEEESTIRAWRGSTNVEAVTQTMPLSEIPTYAYLREHKALLHIDDTRRHALWRTDIMEGLRVRSTINAPLVVRDRCIGALSVDSEQVAHFSREDALLLQRLANHAAIALENARLMDETRQHNEMLAALNSLAATVSASPGLDELLTSALKMVADLTGFESGDIHLCDEAGEYLRLQARHNYPGDFPPEVETIAYGEGLSGKVWQTGEPMVTYDYRSSPHRLSDELDLQTVVCVPLVAKSEVIGTLVLMDRRSRSISDQDLELMVNIGQQLGVGIENARLYEAALARAGRAAQLSLLGVRLTASLDMAETLEIICEHARDIFPVEGVYVWLVEENDLIGAAAIGRGRDQFVATRISLDDLTAAAARAVAHKESIIVNNAVHAEVNQQLLAVTGGLSLLALPLFREEDTIGAMVLVSTEDSNRFSPGDLAAANLLGAHAALAIDNARLFEETTRQVRQLRLVQEVSRDATSYLDLDLLLTAVAERVWMAFGYYSVLITVREGDLLRVRAHLRRGRPLAVGTDVSSCTPREGGIIYRAAERGQPILAPDVSREPLFRPGISLPDTKGELAVPLVLAGEVLGVLDVQSDRVNALSRADLDLLQSLAAQIAISLSNAQLFQTVRDYTVELEARVNERTQRIREQQERTDAILRSVGDGVIVVNLDGQVVLTNPVADALLSGQGHSATLGQRVRDFIGELADHPDVSLGKRLELDEVTFEAHTSKLIQDAQVHGTVIVLHDITHLHEVDRLKSQFVSTVSHELRTPLANLKLYLNLLQDGKPDQRQRYIDTMEQEAARLEHLIDNLLDLSRLDNPTASAMPRQPVDLNELVRLVVTNHAPPAQAKNITVRTNLDNTMPAVMADRNQIIQVLTNLVGNALAYTPEGGDVWIRTANRLSDEQEHVIISVEDSGVGISPDEYQTIFDRFYRGKNARILGVPGSGLGLAIVKEIVEMHGGQIVVSSAVGVGSTFTVHLPVGATGDGI